MKSEDKKSSEKKSHFMKKLSELSHADLFNWFHHKTEDIRKLRTEMRKREKQTTYFANSIIEQLAEAEEDLSYIVVEKKGKIIASTPMFRKTFHYDDSDKSIKGMPFYNALKISLDAPDYIHKLEEELRKTERLEKQTTIFNGKGEEVIIKFTKYEPVLEKIGNKTHSYTRVDVYEIGLVERGKNIVRKLHFFNGDVKTLSELIIKNMTEENRLASEKEKDGIMSGNYKKKTRIKPVSSVAWKDMDGKERRKLAKERLKKRKVRKKDEKK